MGYERSDLLERRARRSGRRADRVGVRGLRTAAAGALVAFVSILGLAAPAQAAPPSAPTIPLTIPKSGQTVSLAAYLDPGSVITDVTPISGGMQASLVAPTEIALSSTGSASYPNYTFAGEVQYTVELEGESSSGLLALTVVQKPWVFQDGVSTATVKPGGSANLRVTARGSGFSDGVATSGQYSVKAPGPAVGTAQVASDGTVTYTAPESAAYGTYSFTIVATDDHAQQSETYTPFAVTVASAEAETFGVEIPYESANPGTRVDILPDHAGGVNPRVTDVSANIGNATVGFDGTGATFTPPAGYAWDHSGQRFTSYAFAAIYTVTDDNGSVTGQLNVRVLRPPVLSVDAPSQYVGAGRSASTAVRALNQAAIPSAGGYEIVTQPAKGTATVSDQGVVSFDATGTDPGEQHTVEVRVTDRVQQSRTISVDFTSYDAAVAPDIDGLRADGPFTLDLLDGASGEGARLAAASVVLGDAQLTADLPAGTVEVTPVHTWAEGESRHSVAVDYTIEDLRGGTDEGTAEIVVLRAPAFANTAAANLTKRVIAGASAHFSATVQHAQNLPEVGAYAVTRQPERLLTQPATPATAALAPSQGAATVDDSGRVTVDTAALAVGSTYSFDVAVTDLAGQSETQTFRLTVVPVPADRDAAAPGGRLASSGAGSPALEGLLPAGAGLILAAAVLYGLTMRRRRADAR